MKKTKTFWQSRTVRASMAGILAGAVALLLHYTGEVQLDGAALATTMTTVLTSAASIWYRIQATLPIESSKGGSGPAAMLVALAFVLTLSVGCGGLTYRCKTLVPRLEPDPPGKMTAHCDGEKVFEATVSGRADMVVICPTGRKRGYTPEGAPTCLPGGL